MQQKLMNKMIEAFKDGGAISEVYVKDHGSTMTDVLNVFKGNQYVKVKVVEISKRKYVTGSLDNKPKEVEGVLPLTLQNYNNEEYMAAELPKYEKGDV